MATEVTLPALGESVTEGTVTRWLKAAGDTVEIDDPLVEVSTDKVDTEVPSPVAGVLLEIKVTEDETAEVGAVLALIGASIEMSPSGSGISTAGPTTAWVSTSPPEPEPAALQRESVSVRMPSVPTSAARAPTSTVGTLTAPTSTAPRPTASTPTRAAHTGPSGAAARIFATPTARKLAREHGVDPATVRTTGGGRIHKQHILDAVDAGPIASAPAAPPVSSVPPVSAAQPMSTALPVSATLDVPTASPVAAIAQTPAAASGKSGKISRLLGRTEKLSRLRRTIAARMVESLRVSAQMTTVVEVDVTEIARLRSRHQDSFSAREGVKLTFLPFFAKAAIEALAAYPQLNSSLGPDVATVTYHDCAHLGVAVDTDRGLIVPVIPDAGDLGIAGLARKIADVAERTRANKISPDELSGGTFTITNTGSVGALFDTPIINQPQVAILGTGAVVKRAVVVTDAIGSDNIAVRSMVYLALTYDHRIVDGADAARFLTVIKKRLEAAAFEGELG
ncbi:2-oxo acid dehydrogenase subunit E2 [Nocardia sp. KC 131]|uniref:2-oxo acid dehydrogenase subunit E2 n=1 Tax=Nocardia arseniciresistens TaxID=3392119 RepID=UPI00398F7679